MALKENSKYGLLSRDSLTSANLSCVQVKLTDSALKFIEDILRSNRTVRPTLEIDDDIGIFRIPDGGGQRDFHFTVAPMPGDLNGSFDCIKQSSNGRLEALDTITQKITVKATDDVYQTTRDKLAEKNEESKKSCANVLDNSKGAIKPKKVIKTIKRNGADSSTSIQSLNRTFNASAASSSWSPHHVSSTSLTSTSPPLPSSSGSAYTSSQGKYPTNVANSQTTAVKKLEKLKRKNQAKMNTAAKEAAQSYSKSNGLSKSEKEKTKAALMAVPLRERLLHMLAVKPTFDTPTLLAKLRTEGVNSSNEHSLSADVNQILGSIASTNSKGHWNLKPEYCSEIDLNWTFYSETDKQLVNRLMILNKANAKPVGTVHPTTESVKRKGNGESSGAQTTKRSKLDTSKEDYELKYTKVLDDEQRNRYKDDFNKEYSEYKQLCDYMEGITQKFVTLAEKLQSTTEGSSDYKKVARRIKKKYKEVTASKEYIDKKPRIEYLHRKLGHIKRMVSDFDHAQLMS